MSHTVLLLDYGKNKINVIKVVREAHSLGLREAKDLVESAPAILKENISEIEANTFKARLEQSGATVQVISSLEVTENRTMAEVREEEFRAPEDYQKCSKCGFEYHFTKLLYEREPEEGELSEDCHPLCGLCLITVLPEEARINIDALIKLL